MALQLVEDLPGVSLALSLHAPTQALRQTIVPSARAYKLDKLMAAIDTYREKTGQKVHRHTCCRPANAFLSFGRDVLICQEPLLFYSSLPKKGWVRICLL